MLEYNLDVDEESYWHIQTPDNSARLFPFYVTECGYFSAGDKYYTKRDGLNSFLLIVTVSGSGFMRWKDRRVNLNVGSAVVIDCSIYQEYATNPGEKWRFYFLHFDGMTDGFKNSIFQAPTPVKLRSLESVLSRIRTIDDLISQTSVSAYANQSHAVSGILTELIGSLEKVPDPGEKQSRPEIRELASYIHDHCKEDLGIDDFTDFIRLSKHHMIRLFKQQIGITPYKYMHKCRINLAQELLRHSDVSINEVAFAVGYEEPIMFIRHFKYFVGVTPGEYRNGNMIL